MGIGTCFVFACAIHKEVWAGSTLSEYASKNLVKEVDVQVSAVIAKNSNNSILSDAIPICLVDTIQKFDATLQSTMIKKMREMDSKPWSEWTKDDIFLGMKEMGEHDPYPIMRRACAGSTVLIAVIIEHSVWVTSLGDSTGICNICLRRSRPFC